MSQRLTHRPGEKVAPTAQAPAQKGPDAQEATRRDLEQLAEKESAANEIDAEAASRVGAQMGNSALAAMIAERAARGGGQQSEGEEEEEELEQGSEEDVADQAVEQSLPGFSGGGGPAGGAGGAGGAGLEQAPWDVGPMFGGDDDDAGGFDGNPTWRPLPLPADPDAEDDGEVDLEDVDPQEGERPEAPALDHDAAAEALGQATLTPSLLTRGLRHPQRVARVPFDAEALVDTDASSHAIGRLRAVARFAAHHADEPAARALACVAAVAGEAVFPEAGGMAGATARAACVAEGLLERLSPAWSQLFEVAIDGRARPWAEQAAMALAGDGVLGAPALFVKALGVRGLRPGELPPRAGALPAAVHALAVAARLRPVPLVDRCTSPPRVALPDDPLAAIDAVLAAFTDAAPAEDDGGVSPDDVRALLAQIDRLLSGIGVVQVELAAAALAAAPWIDVPRGLAVLRRASVTLRDAARRAFAAGERVEWCVGTDDVAGLRVAARDAQSARERVVRARDAALQRLAWLLSQHGSPWTVPAAVDASELAVAESAFARGRPEDARDPLARASALPGGLGRAAASLLAGLHLSRGAWDAAIDLGAAQLTVAVDGDAPFAVADAAITVAAASEDWRSPLVVAADYLRAVDAGGALNLLRARWAEEAGTRAS